MRCAIQEDSEQDEVDGMKEEGDSI